jgi:capsular polysaccharide biosynthesis protein
MIERVAEAFFRHAVLIILPLIVIPLDVGAAVLATPPQFEAQAGMWAERATYLTYTQDDNPYLSPAQNQQARLLELMRTHSFTSIVAQRAGLTDLARSEAGLQALDQVFARDFEAFSNGDHLLILRFRSESRSLALTFVNAIADSFKERIAATVATQGQLAIDFYNARLAESESRLKAARQELTRVIDATPGLASSLKNGGVDAARLDPQFAEAQRKADSAQADADQARTSLERAQLDVAAAKQGGALSFRVADPAVVSAGASRQVKKVLVYPIVGLLIGLLVSAGLLLFFALSDHSIRSLKTLAPDAVILGVLPHMRPVGASRRAGATATRRAISYLAGGILPSGPSGKKRVA